jgi:hypothetical protein
VRFMSRKVPGRRGRARGNSIVALDSGRGDGDIYPPKGASNVLSGISDNALTAPTHARPPEQKKRKGEISVAILTGLLAAAQCRGSSTM